MKFNMLNSILISSLTKISTEQSKKLAKIGLTTVRDLLFHLPIRYEDHSNISLISNLLPEIYALVAGKILNCNYDTKKSKKFICQISDGSGTLTLYFFNFNNIKRKKFIIGKYLLVYGKIKLNKNNAEMFHPNYRIYNKLYSLKLRKNFVPIYPTTDGVKQSTLYKLTKQALDLMDSYEFEELLPLELTHNMISLSKALHIVHRPPNTLCLTELMNKQHQSQKRIIIEKLIAYNLSILASRDSMNQLYAQPIYNLNCSLKNRLLSLLPFKLTKSQIRVMKEIEHDMALDTPMMRLIQGDVGSGKTLVAALAALNVISHGKQVVLVAPTILLAKQHINNFTKWFTPLGIKVGCLLGKQKNEERLMQYQSIANGEIKMVIGTHSILNQSVKFSCLSLVIIDEQQRFGVNQRLTILKKGMQKKYYPHQLMITATPIPRTLAMTIYANLNISVIDELPPGRIPISTVIIPNKRRNDVINHINDACIKNDHQIYWICTRIKESEFLEVQSAEETWKKLQKSLPNLNVGLLHGRMTISEKQKIIKSFKLKEINLLVSTTAIEVGIDINNASIIVIENSERLGLTQLHQLRGRVGRGKVASYCVLLYKSPLSKITRKRLQILRDNDNGFKIAQKDLEIRGHGELLGTRQSGNIEYKVINLMIDQKLLYRIQPIASYIHKFYPLKAQKLINRWIINCNYCFNA